MSTTKRINGDYTIQSVDKDNGDNVIINTHTFILEGNLLVTGSTSEVEVSQTAIIDPIITLGKGNTGAFVYLGIEVEKSPTTKAGLRWNSLTNQWEISSDNIVWTPIGAGGGDFYLVNDPDPHLGGNLNVNGFTITSDDNTVVIDDNLLIPHRLDDPAPVLAHTRLYAKEPENGGTGLYTSVHDDGVVVIQDELISRRKAIIYSLIF